MYSVYHYFFGHNCKCPECGHEFKVAYEHYKENTSYYCSYNCMAASSNRQMMMEKEREKEKDSKNNN